MLALGKLILRHLSATGEDKQDFAKAAGVTPQQLSTWISPKAKIKGFPSVDTLRGLERALGISRQELLAVIGEDLDYSLTEVEMDPDETLLVAAVRPLTPKQKQFLTRLAKDFPET